MVRCRHNSCQLNPFARFALLFIAAASLILIQRTEAAAQPPLVTIQTRVVGTGPNPYSTQVGNGPLAPPSTYTANGSGPGFHVVILVRANLALEFNDTYGLDYISLNSMRNRILGLDNRSLVIISSIGPPTSIALQATFFLINVAQYLGAISEGYMYSPGLVSPSAYSLIAIPGSGAPPTQVSTIANPDTDGNISGALVSDINNNYAFVFSKFVTVQTMTGPQADTIMIGNRAFEAPPLASGTLGGFHLLIVKRAALGRIATDPSVVLLHTSYSTNSNNSSIAKQETDRMASDLSRFPRSGNLIFIIASLGLAGFNVPLIEQSLIDITTIDQVIMQLGGAGDAVKLANGFYSIIGIPNSGDPTLSPEVRSYATPVVSGTPVLSGNITAVLQKDSIGLFTPVSSSAFPPNIPLDLTLYSTAFAAPGPWPVAPHGSESTCPTNAQQCPAYKWVSAQILCNGNTSCTNEDVRGEYPNLNIDLNGAVLDSLAYPPQPTPPNLPAPGLKFSETAFNQVVAQLKIELQLVNDIRLFFANNLAVQTSTAILEQDKLQNAYAGVTADVQLPASTPLSPFNTVGVLRNGLMVAQIAAGGIAPEAVPAFALGSALLYLDMQFNNTPAGASKNQIISTYANLESNIAGVFTSGLASGGVLESLLLTDWNKLETIGTNLENAQPGSAWYFSPKTNPAVATQLANAFTVSFYQALMPAKYQIVTFDNVPFGNPSSYDYQYDCGKKSCACARDIYSPPSGAWTINPGGATNFIYMAISPSDGSYPSNALTGELFCTMGLYYWDFFLSQRGWSAMADALPQGWSDYLQNGMCPNPASGRSFRGHGLPGPVLTSRPVTPLVNSSTAPAAAVSKIKPAANPYCSLSVSGRPK